MLFLRGGEPFGIGRFADNLDGDRHIGVVLAAKLGTLAEVDAFLFCGEPQPPGLNLAPQSRFARRKAAASARVSKDFAFLDRLVPGVTRYPVV